MVGLGGENARWFLGSFPLPVPLPFLAKEVLRPRLGR